MQERPRFRTDLVAHPVTEAGKRFVDVTDPDSGSTFRFYEVEYSVACSMDGKRDFGGLVSWSQEELGLQPSRSELETVVSTLGELGYLAEAGGADMMLGDAGKSPMSKPREPVAAPDVELGRAGATEDVDDAYEMEADTQIVSVEAEEPEVSVDLSQHLSVDQSDVKEAVRQSRVMGAVGEDDEDAATKVKGEPLTAEAVSKATEDAIAAEVDAEIKKEAAGAKPITIPSKAPAVKKVTPKKAPTPAEKAVAALPKPSERDEVKEPGGGAMTAVLVILLIVFAAGGWFVYTNFLQKSDDAASEVVPTNPAPAPVAKKKS